MLKNNKISDAEFGQISVQRSARARRILFRVRNGSLCVTVPDGLRCDEASLLDLVDKNREPLRKLFDKVAARTSQATLYDGKIITLEESEILIVADRSVGLRKLVVRQEGDRMVFAYNPEHDVPQDLFARGLSQFILRHITALYGHVLLQMVEEYAGKYGLQVKEVRIGRGRRTLGHCSRGGVITISAFVLFFPRHLRQYIVCHELAHLTHFDHSKAFHALCDKYCEGNESLWRREVRQFCFPISI